MPLIWQGVLILNFHCNLDWGKSASENGKRLNNENKDSGILRGDVNGNSNGIVKVDEWMLLRKMRTKSKKFSRNRLPV